MKDTAEAKTRAIDWLRETCGVRAEDARLVKNNHGWWLVRTESKDVWVRESTGQIQAKGKLTQPDKRVVEARVTQWAERAFGLPVRAIESQPHKERKFFRTHEGMLVTVHFDDPKQTPAQVFVRAKDAKIIPKTIVPDLTEHGIGALRDRLGSTFISQLLSRMVHGDPHDGNFFVMPDGKTIALLDFGLAIDLKLHDAAGPLQLMAGAYLQEPKKMASALMSMAMLDPALSERDLLRIHVKLARQCRDVIKEVNKEIDQKTATLDFARMSIVERTKTRALLLIQGTCTAMERSIGAMLTRVGLPPQPHVLQTLKATFSMGGNIALIENDLGKSSIKGSLLGAIGDFCLYNAVAPIFGESMHKRKAARMDRMTFVDARALAAANA